MQTHFTNPLRSNPSWRMGLIALFVGVLTWLAVPQAAWAATFTVTKTADTNDGACNADCSLREAIVAANAAAGADIITLPAGTYTLARSGVDNTAVNGDLDVTGPLTINGAAQATTIIEAGSSSATAIDRIFSFNPVGSAAGFAVSLNNLTLRNGKNINAFATQESDGGCFDFDAGTAGTGTLSLTNVTVSNCETTDGSGGGFVIFFPVGGAATLNNITVQNNSATRPAATGGLGNGGGFMVGGAGGPATLTINNSLIDNNRALRTGTTISSIGGGISIGARSNPAIATNYQIHGTRITNNQAAGDGGGIHSLSPLTIDNVGGVALFNNNQAGNNGGGLFLRHPSQTTNINKVAFTGNSAVNLGGGLRSSNGDAQTLTVSFSRFVNNTAASGKGSGLSSYTAVTTATNNWWGCSTGPTASPCDTAQIDIDNTNAAGTLTTAPWLRLNLTAATNPLVTGQSTGLTASFLTNSNNGAVALSNLDVLLGLPVTWSSVGGTLSGQQTTIQTNGTATASYQATAAAAGNRAVAKVDNDGTTTGSNVLNLTVNKANTTATITADTPDPSAAGQSVTVNYNVTVNTPGAGTPTGNVTVSDGVNSCTGTVAAGTCSLALTTVGARTLTATYAGDANFNSSTSAGVAHTVTKGATTTAITADTPDPSVVGQSVVVQYTVTPQGAGTPTGNVTVSDGTVSCTATVAAGQCALALTSVGAKNLTATYAGDANFTGSTSSAATHTVNKAGTTTTITADTPDPSTVGQVVTVNFSVLASAPGAGSPTGTVTVSDGVDSCTGTVAAGSCAITLANAGNRFLTATYAGDSNFNPSTSADEPHIVNQNDSTTAITADTPDPSVVGQTVVVQYTVTPGTATGNVGVTSDVGLDSCTDTVAAGQCALTFTSAGAKLLTATYTGDDNFFPSASTAVPHTVNKAATTTTISADTPDPSTVGQAVTVSYNVTVNAPGAGTPTGNVTISDGVDSCTATVADGQCVITLSTTGARTLTATYVGDSNFTGSTSAGVDHTVNPATQAPQITTQPTDQSVCAGATASFSAAASGIPAPTVQWQVSSDNGATWNDLSGETNATLNVVTSAADNGKQYRAVFTNSAGSATSNAATLTVNSAPTITTQPTNQTVNEGQSVSFSAAANGSPAPTVQWQVSTDSGATWNDLSGETATTLTFTAQSSDNGKQYRAIFTNSCGTVTTDAATLTVNTLPPPDTTAPDTTIDSQPANPSNSGSASFTFSGTDNVTPPASLTFECSLDGAAFAACSSPQNYSGLADGSHTFQVRAKDAAGNVDATPASYTWTINTAPPPDTTAPDTTIDSQPANPSNSGSASFTFSGTDNVTPPASLTFECSLDGAAFAACSSPQNYSGLADGSHTFQVRAKDAASNVDATPASYTWTINTAPPPDTTAPDTTINSQPANPSNSGSASFTFSGTDNVTPPASLTFECSLDGAAFAACTSPQNYSGLADGSHTFQVRAKDAASNIDATPASYTWTINTAPPPDTTAPDTTINSQPANPSNSGSASFTFSGTDNVTPPASLTFECSLDGAAFAACSSPQNYSGLADGSHTFQVRAKDAAGNVDATPASYTWTINTASGNTFIANCGSYAVYRTPQGQYTAAGWSGAIKVGTNSNNTLNGGSGPDLMLGLGGNDSLQGNGGNDVLCGGDSVDLVQGHAGNDYLDGGNGSDVLNGGSGDYDQLVAGDGADALLDGDGVSNAQGGPGNDVITFTLRNGWRDANGQARFAGLAAGYGNDTVGVAILGSTSFLLDITGDERDNPASPLEGTNDALALGGVINPASSIIKFETQIVVAAEESTLTDESGAELLSEPVGEESTTPTLNNRIFLAQVSR